MPIASLNPTLAAPQANLPAGLDKSGNPLARAANAPSAPRREAPQAEAAPAAADTVSLSAEVASIEASDLQVPIYAEIWKGSIKLAQVDIHGQVTSFSGLVPSGGGGLAGPLLAAQRTVQVAQQTGGEIRAAGQALDSQTLLMRARLASTYRS